MASFKIDLQWMIASAMALAVSLASGSSMAALVFADKNARDRWPETAPFITSPLPEATTDFNESVDSRGVRSNRIQAQTFKVFEAFSVESILIGYRWNTSNPDPVTFRVIEVDDIGLLYNPATVNVLAGPIEVTFGDEPNPSQASRFYAMEFEWDASLSGGQPLILTPRSGQQGYAIEFVGSATTSPIAILNRSDNPLAESRAMEQTPEGVGSGPPSNVDFVVAITGTLISTPVPGDFNGDGNVDGADFVIWQTNFPNNTGEATLDMGDANADGNVDGADFVIWQTNFPTIASAGGTAVPEPGAVLLAIVGMGIVGGIRLRRFISSKT